MRYYLGVTDNSWYDYLSRISPEDVNFWQPGGNSIFKILEENAPFLFKLKAPNNAIGGIGFFSRHTFLTISMAWDVFGNRNGLSNIYDFRNKITHYRKDKFDTNPSIGCIVLTNPIFFKKEDWIDVSKYYSKTGIVRGKSFDTATIEGEELWKKINNVLKKYEPQLQTEFDQNTPEGIWPGDRNSVQQKIRIGQGAFRVMVTDAYARRCSITGEKTLPVLEAAHIKPFNLEGPNSISNALLLRSDIHKLFDNGYITISKDFKINISKAIREEFQNGKEYYQFHGKSLICLPEKHIDRPDGKYLEWHNSIFKG